MNKYILKDLLTEYEKIRLNNTHDLEARKSQLYSSNPKLQEIDNKVSELSIDTAKAILKDNSKDYLNNLKKEINDLKKEKEPKYKTPISQKENIEDIKKAAVAFIENFDDENTKNLIFSGGTGLRKNISF